MKKYLHIALRIAVGIFAAIGLLFTLVFIGMQFGLLNVRGSIFDRNSFFNFSSAKAPCSASVLICNWNETPEWATVSGGLTKDAEIIQKVSGQTGVSTRMIASVVVPEQLRFFTSEREVFKSYFEPLKILGSLSQFSLGVSGIKQETADMIENNANNPASPFYPGAGMSALLMYSPAEGAHDSALYNRLTDPKNHYYSYLYTALYIKEVESQWSRAGYPIDTNPAIVTTLFNIGFADSKPNANPQIGGSQIDAIGGKTYLFGELGADFYNSNELTDIFHK